jgi:peptidylprolyl isomerase
MKRLLICLVLLSSFNRLEANSIDSIDLDTYLFNNNIQTKQTGEGLRYRIDVRGSGDYPEPGDYVMINYIGRLLDGTEFDSSEEEPFVFQLGYRQVIKGWEFGVPLFQVGSKGTLYLPPNLGFGSVGAGKIVPPNSALIYDIEVLQIMDEESYDEYMEALDERERIEFEQAQQEQLLTDNRIINTYARENKIKVKRLASGVSYAFKKKGKGKRPQEGDRVRIHYEGFLTDGTQFDSSYDRKKTFDFTIGQGKVIQGLEEAIKFFKKGSTGWVLIPSKYAYGPMEIDENGIFIPANSVLAFKIKVVDIAQ